MLRAHGGQAGQAVVAGHVQVEQDQVDAGLGVERGEHAVEAVGLADLRVGHGIGGGLPQRGAEQRVVVGDQQHGHACSLASPVARKGALVPKYSGVGRSAC